MKDKSNALVTWATGCFEAKAKEYLAKLDTPVEKDLVLAIIEQSKNNYRTVKDAAADIGTAVHDALEMTIKSRADLCPSPTLPLETVEGFTQDMVDMANAAIQTGIQYLNDHDIQLVQSETPRWSPYFGYVGTNDLIARIDGKLSVLDFKTGKRLYPEVFLQTAAYQMAYQEEFPDDLVVQRVGLNVGKDGHLEDVYRDNSTLKSDFNCFLALLEVYRWHQENVGYYSKKERKSIPTKAPRIVRPLV